MVGVILMDAAYHPPGRQKFDLDKALSVTERNFGYGIYWYWKLFTASNGPQILDGHRESLWTVMHGEPETWLDTLCKRDGLRDFLLADKRQPVLPYATEERRQKWLTDFTKGGFDAPLNYYRAMVCGEQDRARADVPKENITINAPFLFWGGQRDKSSPSEMLQGPIKAGLLPDHKVVLVNSGHWAHLDQPDKFGKELVGWLKERYSSSGSKL